MSNGVIVFLILVFLTVGAVAVDEQNRHREDCRNIGGAYIAGECVFNQEGSYKER